LHLLTLLCFRHRGIPLGIPVGPACGLSAPLGVPDSDRGRSLRSYHEHELTVTSSCDGKPRELGRGSISRAAPSPAPCPYLIGRQRPSRPGLSMPVYRAQVVVVLCRRRRLLSSLRKPSQDAALLNASSGAAPLTQLLQLLL